MVSSGPLPNMFRLPPPDPFHPTRYHCRENSSTSMHPKLGRAGGTVTARRTLENIYSRTSSDAGFLDRGRSATYPRSGGNQPAYQSMINRRFEAVPPTLSIYRPDRPISAKR